MANVPAEIIVRRIVEPVEIESGDLGQLDVEVTNLPLEVRVTDVEIPFGSMVGLMVELAIAAVPAAIIIGIMLKILEVAFGLLARLPR